MGVLADDFKNYDFVLAWPGVNCKIPGDTIRFLDSEAHGFHLLTIKLHPKAGCRFLSYKQAYVGKSCLFIKDFEGDQLQRFFANDL